jgi:hypothetical protein
MNNIPRFGRKGLIKRLQNAGSTSLSKIRAFRNRRLRLRLRLAQSRGRLRKNLINVANHIFNINVKKSRIAQLLLDKVSICWKLFFFEQIALDLVSYNFWQKIAFFSLVKHGKRQSHVCFQSKVPLAIIFDIFMMELRWNSELLCSEIHLILWSLSDCIGLILLSRSLMITGISCHVDCDPKRERNCVARNFHSKTWYCRFKNNQRINWCRETRCSVPIKIILLVSRVCFFWMRTQYLIVYIVFSEG